jgi:hypothetical protein
MKQITMAVTAALILASATAAFSQSRLRSVRESLNGFQEIPVVSTTGSGTFHARIDGDGEEISYVLTFRDLEGDVRQAHIHVGTDHTTGGIVLWLCQTAASPSPVATTPQCSDPANLASARTNTVRGTLRADDVIPQSTQPNNHGIAAGEFDEVIRLIRAGKTYANVHSSKFPSGEIRSQIDHGRAHGNDEDDDDD